jgi:hypothetical protein
MSRASARVGMARSPGARLLGAVGAAGVGIEELARGETVGGFGRSGSVWTVIARRCSESD